MVMVAVVVVVMVVVVAVPMGVAGVMMRVVVVIGHPAKTIAAAHAARNGLYVYGPREAQRKKSAKIRSTSLSN